MSYRSLRDFIEKLEAAGELVRVVEPVSVNLEMTEIQTRLLAEGGPAVLFERPVMDDGSISTMPVLVNLFGTVKRVAMGVTLEGKERTTTGELREVGELLAFLRQPEPPGGVKEALAMAPMLKTVMAMKPASKSFGSAPAQEVVKTGDEIDLDALPIQTCWPGEPAPLITWPLVVTKGPGEPARGRLQPRHLPHAEDDRPRTPRMMRWLKASRRRAASSALEAGENGTAAGGGGARR